MVEPAPPLALKSCMVTGNPKSIMYISALHGYVNLFGIDVRYEASINLDCHSAAESVSRKSSASSGEL